MLPFCFRLRAFPFRSTSFRPLPFRFWLLGLCFFLSSFFPSPPHSGFLGAALSAFASLALPVLSDLISHVFLPGSSYSAFCSFPFIPPGFAPTAVPPVLPSCFRFRAFPLSTAFFRPLPFGSNYSAFRSFFSLLPVLPCRRFLRCFFPLPSSLFPCLPSDSGTQLPALPFSLAVSPHSGYLSASALSFRFRPHPLCFRFRFWLLGSFASCSCREHLLYYHAIFHLSTTFFKNFSFFSISFHKHEKTTAYTMVFPFILRIFLPVL